MSDKLTTKMFKQNIIEAMADKQLTNNLKNTRNNFIEKRAKAIENLTNFEEIREKAISIKKHTLKHLDLYLEKFERKVIEAGGNVHFARNSDEACKIVLDIAKKNNAKNITKGKSMVTEEIGLNDYLMKNGINPIETDLGEYIIQLRKEAPSHIIAPAVHLNKSQIEEDFRREHTHLDPKRELEDARSLLSEARTVLREKFLKTDIGITGANFLIAETGTAIMVTNEGNADLTQSIPKVHIVIASIEKVIPTLEDSTQFLKLLARSATGQELSVYTTFATGKKREDDPDGPEEYHVILLDNGRSSMLGTEFEDMLRCIKCAACMNHCPIYHEIGGHAYGWVYPGPMGSVLTPALIGIERAHLLPNASTFCGKCESVCPMKIPLPKMMRHWREKAFERGLNPASERYGLKLWSFLAKHPHLYNVITNLAVKVLYFMGGKKIKSKKFPGLTFWLNGRDFIISGNKTFQNQWKYKNKKKAIKA